jgi:prophage maintenance system killer protein
MFTHKKVLTFVSAVTFLEINGQHFDATEQDVVERTMALAAHEIGAEAYAAWIHKHTARPRKPSSPRSK